MATTQTGVVLRHLRELVTARDAHTVPDAQLLERFTRGREEAAFEALVRRHGPLVLGVCRRVLRHEQDAEDAFQATFLVLARKAASIGKRDSVGSWLYQVAYHLATRARKRTANRHRREERAAARPGTDALDEVTGRELLAVFDEELQKLPARCREPLVLCYLQGLTRDEAARRLRCSESTLKRRLEEGKADLRRRLARRGLALPAALLVAGAVGSAVPAALVATTTKVAAGAAVVVPAQVIGLARGSLRTMAAGRLKTVAAVLLAGALVGAGLFGYRATPDAPPPAAEELTKAAAPAALPADAEVKPAEDDTRATTFNGRVLDPDGKPAVGARVYLLPADRRAEAAPKVRAETDKDGRFSFQGPREGGQLFATAAGYGPAWVVTPGKLEDNPLRLARDDVAVSGRLLDLQGQPVAGAAVRVHALKASPEGKLDRWLEAVKVRRDGLPTESEYLPKLSAGGLAHFFPPVTTDEDGRFRIKGIGRERAAALVIEAPAIETKEINVLTRPGAPDVRVPIYSEDLTGEQITYVPPTFTHTAAPCRVVAGVVRDKATRRPVAGAVVRAADPVGNPVWFIRTTTDKDGRFRLTGLPRKPRLLRENAVVALPPAGESLLAVSQAMPEGDGAKPAAFDFDLPRGVWLEGQVKDRATGRGVEARLGYFVFAGGPNEEEVRALYIPPVFGLSYSTDREGKFRIVAAPYRGLIGARAKGEAREHYRVGVGADKIEGATPNLDGTLAFSAHPFSAQSGEFDTLMEVKPEKGATSVRCDLVLEPGRALTVQVRGPDGKPLDGVRANGQLARSGWEHDPLPADFPVHGLAPGQGRTLLLRHPGKGLAVRRDVKADERGPVVVTLEPAAAVTGRLLDDRGRPLKHSEIHVYYRPAKDALWHFDSHDFRTDAEGKFRIDGLVPGMVYNAGALPPGQPFHRMIFEELSLRSGETKDLGDVKPRNNDAKKKGDEADEPKRPAAAPPDRKPSPPAAAEKKEMTVSGQVRDADGKPLAGAEVAVVGRRVVAYRGGDLSSFGRTEVLGRGKTDAEGHFRLDVPRTSALRFRSVTAIAGAADHGLGWLDLNPDADRPTAEIRLAREQVIRGRFVDLQGQPAAGVTVRVGSVDRRAPGEFKGVHAPAEIKDLPIWPKPAVTDKDGRFELHGVARGVMAQFGVCDDRFASQGFAVTTDGKDGPKDFGAPLEPAHILEGTVAYADTGKSVPGARLTVYAAKSELDSWSGMDARADENGRFCINPSPGNLFEVSAYAPDGEPYLTLKQRVKWPKAAVKQRVELKLPRGVLVRGKLTEAGSGRALAKATVLFIPQQFGNPNFRRDVVTGWFNTVVSGDDGTFAICALPGPGHLLARGPTPDYVFTEIGERKLSAGKEGGERQYAHAVVPLDLKSGADPRDVAMTLKPAVTVKGRVVGPDGRPVAEALMLSRLDVSPVSSDWRGFPHVVREGRFELHGCDPKKNYPVHFLDAKNKAGATVELSGKQAGADVTVRLAPCGAAATRLLDADGKTLAGYRVWLEMVVTPGPHRLDLKAREKGELAADAESVANIDRANHWDGPLTDAEGRVTFPALVPGATYRVVEWADGRPVVTYEFKAESGKTVKLPDVVRKK